MHTNYLVKQTKVFSSLTRIKKLGHPYYLGGYLMYKKQFFCISIFDNNLRL